ncbi:MAG TPA: hypothetical protein PL045_08485 [Chitinophagaceae bacterium]|nr:hypothetical protein [Chitinophagaceae bacterium]
MTGANVKLSQSELELVSDAKIILTKNRIVEKVYLLFGKLAETFQQINATMPLSAEVLQPSPKIYKGEQYLQLPYVMLDCPRYFKGEDAFAVRCMFWWGNFFSITLHLSGVYKEKHAEKIFDALKEKQNSDWHICISKDQWLHHFGKDNYALVNTKNLFLQNFSFIKLAKKISLHEWDNAEEFFTSTYREMMRMVSDE